MNPEEEEDVSIDLSKIKKFFTRDKKEESKTGETKESSSPEKQDQEGEEITIDFSKIKSFFKSDEKEEKKTEEATKEYSSEGKDDEISIDFGKIKNFFKSDEKEESPSKEIKKDDEDIEFSFDLAKIKKFFKPDEKESVGSDEEVPVDWSRIIDFFKKYGVVFIALIPIILSIYVRIQIGFLPFTDKWATDTVINGIRSQASGEINQQYPNLPDANKNALVETKLQQVISQNKKQIDDTIRAYSNYFKSFFQDENGKSYMPDIDPYYWFRYAKNIIKNGYPGDILKDGKSFDTYQLAPIGRFVVPDMFHSYSWAYFYKFIHFFAPDLTLMRAGFYLTIFISALCVLLVFLIGRKIAGNFGGFFAALMMAINGAFLSRSLHPDNDIWVIFFPLLVTWLFVSTIDVKNTFKIIIISSIAGFFTGLFIFAWTGWWYIFDFLLVTGGVTFFYLVLINFNEIRKNIRLLFSNIAIRDILVFSIVYFVSTAAFVVIFSGFPAFRNSFLGPLSFPSIKAPVGGSLWPNVLTTVAELNEGSINGIINSIGGSFLFFISLLGLILTISRSEGIRKFDFIYIIGTIIFYGILFVRYSNNKPLLYQSLHIFSLLIWIILPIMTRIAISIYKRDSSYDFRLSILLSLWVVSTIFASIKGIRFTVLLAPAFSVAFGVALGKAYLYLSKSVIKELKIHKVVVSSILVVLLLLMYVNPIRGAIAAASSDIPIVNDAWYNALIAIKQNSSENAIITSWWDFGHHFKAIANRSVTFDGTTQTSSPAHWVGKLLMTDNEAQAVGILRMLDCGQNKAYDELYKINNDTHLSLRILNEIILLDKKEAEKKLKVYGFDEKQIEKILPSTHCEPPESYFIASEDMIGKSGVWSHFGSWNFERADIWQNARKMPQEAAVQYMIKKFNYTRERAENIYFEIQAITSDSEANSWVAPWPGYGGTVKCHKNENEIYVCQPLRIGTDNSGRDIYVNFNVNLSNYGVFGQVGDTVVKPSSAAFTTETGLFKKEINGSNLGLGITFTLVSEKELQAIISSRELAGSMFTRMFYMQGHGLRYFKLFNHQRGLTGTDIYVYKVDWKGKNATIVQDYVNYLKNPIKEESATENLNLTLSYNNTNIKTLNTTNSSLNGSK